MLRAAAPLLLAACVNLAGCRGATSVSKEPADAPSRTQAIREWAAGTREVDSREFFDLAAGGDEIVPVLDELYPTISREKKPGLVGLAGLTKSPAAHGLIIKALADENEQVRVAAARAAGTSRVSGAGPRLRSLAKQKGGREANEYLAALAKIGYRSAEPEAVAALDGNDREQWPGAIALAASIRTERCEEALVALLNKMDRESEEAKVAEEYWPEVYGRVFR